MKWTPAPLSERSSVPMSILRMNGGKSPARTNRAAVIGQINLLAWGGSFCRSWRFPVAAGGGVLEGSCVAGWLDAGYTGCSSHSPQNRHFTASLGICSLQSGHGLNSASCMVCCLLELVVASGRMPKSVNFLSRSLLASNNFSNPALICNQKGS